MRLQHRNLAVRLAVLPTIALAALALAGCSGSSSGTAGTPVAAGATSTPSAGTSASPNASAFQAYRACLAQHGVTLPSRQPGAGGSGFPGGGFPGGSGAPDANRPGPTASANPQFQAAQQACASLRPSGGFGFGAGGSAALAAFRSCMSDHGVTLPSSGPGAGLRGLNSADPATAAALKVCQALLPTRPPGTAAPTPSPSV